MNLPIQQTDDQNLMLMQNRWASIINPVLSQPINSGILLNQLVLSSGDNVINHKLGRKLQGWVVVGNDSTVTFYDNQASNQQPQLTLILNSSGSCLINLLVF